MSPSRFLTPTFARLLLCGAIVAALVVLASCRVSKPFRGPGYAAGRGVVHPNAGSEVFVAVTRGDVSVGSASAFSRELSAVLDTMNAQEGLIGYAVRKELLGSGVWTMSVWIDEESVERFARSPAHRKAVTNGGIPRSSFISAYAWVEAGKIPLSWAQAERLLEDQPNQE